jgi:competence protein ComFC
VYTIGPYSGYLKEIILKYKYHQCKKLSIFLSSMIQPWIEHCIDIHEKVWIIPVPCSQTGKITRGWDQMQVIAKILDHIPGTTYHDILRRVGKGEQKLLGRQERMSLCKGKFKIKPFWEDQLGTNGTLPIHAIVIDDVFTTGTTIQECIELVESCFSCPTTGICLAMD